MNVPRIEFEPRKPVNLGDFLLAQAMKLIELGAPQQLCISATDFLDKAMAVIRSFTYQNQFAEIGLDQVMLMHYGLPNKFLAEAGKVIFLTDLTNFATFEDVELPDGFRIIHCQFGTKYKNVMISDVKKNHHQLEQLGVAKEGLTAYLYWGNPLLEECFMDFPGSLSEEGHTPQLLLRNKDPFLCADVTDEYDPQIPCEKPGDKAPARAYPDFGSLTVRRNF